MKVFFKSRETVETDSNGDATPLDLDTESRELADNRDISVYEPSSCNNQLCIVQCCVNISHAFQPKDNPDKKFPTVMIQSVTVDQCVCDSQGNILSLLSVC